jgi:hypothetical protein
MKMYTIREIRLSALLKSINSLSENLGNLCSINLNAIKPETIASTTQAKNRVPLTKRYADSWVKLKTNPTKILTTAVAKP